MSETRQAYTVTLLDELLQPGPKLDVLVTSITDVEGSPSTDPAAAMEAWAWLEEHNPWKPDRICLVRWADNEPSVSLIHYELDNYVAVGTTYPHAISLAVCEAGRALGVIDN